MTDICKKCYYLSANEKTFPFCIKCAYCSKNLHVLQLNLDGTLPFFCQICQYQKWKKEFDTKNMYLFRK